MTELQKYLLESPIAGITKTIRLERMSDHLFTVKPLLSTEYSFIQKDCLENPNSPKKRNMNMTKFNRMLAVYGLADPNFKDAEFISSLHAASGSDAIEKVLLPGEIAIIASAVLEVSGFSERDEDEIEEVKND